jgi:hypothetical protein
MRVVQQVFEEDGALGVSAVLVEDAYVDARGADAPRPHVFARLTFEA